MVAEVVAVAMKEEDEVVVVKKRSWSWIKTSSCKGRWVRRGKRERESARMAHTASIDAVTHRRLLLHLHAEDVIIG